MLQQIVIPRHLIINYAQKIHILYFILGSFIVHLSFSYTLTGVLVLNYDQKTTLFIVSTFQLSNTLYKLSLTVIKIYCKIVALKIDYKEKPLIALVLGHEWCFFYFKASFR